MAEGDAFPLHDIHAHRSRVKQDIHHVVIQQVDFVDVEQTAVRSRQHAWLKMALALLNRAFDVERANHAVFCGRNWQVDERGFLGFNRQRVFPPNKALTAFRAPGGGLGGVTAKATTADDLDRRQ